MVPTRGGEPRQLTSGEQQDRYSVLSPDGTQLAFERGQGDRSGIFLLTLDAGEPTPLTDQDWWRLAPFAWSGDGATIYAHARRVTHLALRIGRSLDLPDDEMEILSLAALLHDVGKVSLPTDILQKAGPLSAGEMEAMRHHPALVLLRRRKVPGRRPRRPVHARLGAELDLFHQANRIRRPPSHRGGPARRGRR